MSLNDNNRFMTCESCGKEMMKISEKRNALDRGGFTRTFCADCYNDDEKRRSVLQR